MEKSHITAFLACALAVVPSCERIDVEGSVGQAADTLTTVIVPAGNGNFKNADVFLYSDQDVRRLEGHVRLTVDGDSAFFRTTAGDKLAVVIANSPRTFNDLALTSYDSMEILPFRYRDETPGFRMMSGSSSCRAGDTLAIGLSSAMCSVSLRSIEHSFNAYRRLEDPVVFLENVSSGLEALRRDSFLPSETTSDTTGMRGMMWEKLPCDIGLYPQYPNITLYCYPNESSVNRSRLVVEGTVDGRIRRFSTDLPLMPFGSFLSADLIIGTTAEKYSFQVY